MAKLDPPSVSALDGSLDSEFMSAKQAAAVLDVKLPTLYAYASRGLVRSVAGPVGRPRRYARADVERLKARSDARRGHGAVAAGALRWGEPVLDSAITEIAPSGHRYRGRDALGLAETQSFEHVADWLWTGDPRMLINHRANTVHARPGADPDANANANADADAGRVLRRRKDVAWWRQPPDLDVVRAVHACVPAHASLMDRLMVTTAIAASRSRDRTDHASALSHARTLLSSLCAVLDRQGRVPRADANIAERLLWACSNRPRALKDVEIRTAQRRAIDQALILIADHELNVSGFAARVAASSGASIHASVSAGLAALSGPKHGAVCDHIETLLKACQRTCATSRDVLAFIRNRARRGQGIAGFGHPLYPDGDPRARALLALVARLRRERVTGRRSPTRADTTLSSLIAAMNRIGRHAPTVEIGLVSLCAALGLETGSATAIFALGRTAGLIAHALEQRQAGFLLRPRARYTGRTTTAAQ